MAANGTAHMAIVTEDGQLWTWGWCALPPATARPGSIQPQVFAKLHDDPTACAGVRAGSWVTVTGKIEPCRCSFRGSAWATYPSLWPRRGACTR